MEEASRQVIPVLTAAEAWNLLSARPQDTLIALLILFVALLLMLHIAKLIPGFSLHPRRLTLPSLLILAYLVIMPVPSILWFCNWSGPIRYSYLLAIDGTPALLLLGAFLASFSSRHPRAIVAGFLRAGLSKSREDGFFRPLYNLMFVVAGLIAALYVSGATYVPLLGSLGQYGVEPGEEVRMAIYGSSPIMVYAYALTVRLFLPFCVLYSYFMGQVYGRKWKFKFWLMLAVAFALGALSLERSPTLGMFGALILAFCLSKGISVSLKHLFTFVMALLAGGTIHLAQYQLAIDWHEIGRSTTGFLVERLWLDPSYMTAVGFQTFNDTTMFLHGSSVRLLSLFGIEFQSFSSVGFVGDLWVNFGWSGVVSGAILLGFALEFIQLKFFRRKSIPFMVVYTLLLANELWLLYGSVLSTMVVSVYAAGVGLLALLPKEESMGRERQRAVAMVRYRNSRAGTW